MTKKTKSIVEQFSSLSLAELWVIAEAALAQVREKTASSIPLPPLPEMSEDEWKAELARRYEAVLDGSVSPISGDDVEAQARSIAP
ncbi:MAG: addiction module protein [Bacteroidota bacterium]